MNDRFIVILTAACLNSGCAANYSDLEVASSARETLGAPASDAPVEAIPAITGFEVTETSTYSDEDEAEYLHRFNRMMDNARSGIGLDSYDPLEPVPGVPVAAKLRVTASPTLSDQAIAQAHSYVAARNTSAFLIWKDGALQYEAYFGDFDAATPVVSKSLAKPMTALLVGRALMQGHIKSLDQPVSDFITEWKGDREREKIKIRYLLDMRSGLLPQGFSPNPDDMLNRAYLHPRHDEIIINDYPMTHETGSRYEYSNANSELVSPLIERATGKRYSEYVSEALLEPIGATGGSVWVNREGGTAHSGCCILLPARSWLRMAMLIMNDGVWEGERLLPAGYVADMRTGTAQNPYYGLGLWIAGPYIERRGFAHPDVPFGKVEHSEPYLDKDLFLFDGNSNQVVYMIPSQNMIVLRTGAQPPNGAPWDNSILPNLLIRDAAQRAGKPLPEPQPK